MPVYTGDGVVVTVGGMGNWSQSKAMTQYQYPTWSLSQLPEEAVSPEELLASSHKRELIGSRRTFSSKARRTTENAAEQTKDRMIAEAIRDQYKKATGQEFPIKEKEEEEEEEEEKLTRFGGLFSGN
ncbi:hypothetical protein VTK56DRAFT_9812 [Thermocarpiscus australiensis]